MLGMDAAWISGMKYMTKALGVIDHNHLLREEDSRHLMTAGTSHGQGRFDSQRKSKTSHTVIRVFLQPGAYSLAIRD